MLLFFFFKQKTAYEIGLGIPAEPLFRSSWKALNLQFSGFNRTLDAINNVFRKFSAFHDETGRRSEERRVGKECRSRGSPYHQKKKETGVRDREVRMAVEDHDRDSGTVSD